MLRKLILIIINQINIFIKNKSLNKKSMMYFTADGYNEDYYSLSSTKLETETVETILKTLINEI